MRLALGAGEGGELVREAGVVDGDLAAVGVEVESAALVAGLERDISVVTVTGTPPSCSTRAARRPPGPAPTMAMEGGLSIVIVISDRVMRYRTIVR